MTKPQKPQTASSKPDSLIQRYRRLLEDHKLDYDSKQSLVIEALQLLSNRLEHYTPPAKVGFFGSLFGKSQDNLKGLYIFGGVGTGKTMLMDLFFDALSMDDKKRYHFSAFMEKIHQDIQIARTQKIKDPLDSVADNFCLDTTVLCLDEFQVTDITDAMLLARLFEALFARGLVLITTGNIAPQNLYQNGLNRALFLPFIDLIQLQTDIIELDTKKDYRREGLQKSSFWHIASSTQENLSYLTQWHALTSGFTPKPDTLIINGRTLDVPLMAGKIARFTFHTLCEQPLGSADYLAIAKKYTTIFIDDIPVMTSDQSNEARRFTLLIDSLYDHHTILIASAHGEPDALYPNGKGANAFKRTSSRLLEMGKENYFARPNH